MSLAPVVILTKTVIIIINILESEYFFLPSEALEPLTFFFFLALYKMIKSIVIVLVVFWVRSIMSLTG